MSEGKFGRLSTNEGGYRTLEHQLKEVLSRGKTVALAVENTGKARYSPTRMERLGVQVVVVNSLKFKAVTQSVKKTDRHDASTLAEFLEKEMLPEARQCSQKSEELMRLLKVRKRLVESIVMIENQIHWLLLNFGITSARGEPQNKKEHLRVQHVLAAHALAGVAVGPHFKTVEHFSDEVKKLEKVIAAQGAGDPVVALPCSLPGVGLSLR